MPQFVAPMIGRGVALLTPTADGSTGQAVVTNGSGVLSFATISGGGGDVLVHTADGRLTTETGVPVSTTNRTSQSTIYYTPYVGNQVALYDGSSTWSLHTFTERSLALSGLTSGLNYDVFLYDASGTLTLELVAWTNDTTRATALTTQDGVYVKSGDTAKRYLGTIRTTGTTTTADQVTQRFVWNVQNQVPRALSQTDGTSHTINNVTTAREWNSGTAMRAGFVMGLAGQGLLMTISFRRSGSGNSFVYAAVNTSSGQWSQVNASGFEHKYGIAQTVIPVAGYHYLTIYEAEFASVTVTLDHGNVSATIHC